MARAYAGGIPLVESVAFASGEFAIANVRRYYVFDPEPQVVVSQLHDYNVQLELRGWGHDERRHIDLRIKLMESAFNAMTDAGIDMPFETFRIEPTAVHQSTAT